MNQRGTKQLLFSIFNTIELRNSCNVLHTTSGSVEFNPSVNWSNLILLYLLFSNSTIRVYNGCNIRVQEM